MAAATRAAPATATAPARATAAAPANAPSHLTTSFDSVSYINSHVLPEFECASVCGEHNNASFGNAPGRS